MSAPEIVAISPTAVSDEQQADIRYADIVKRRAACDQCRIKKLKCSGQQPTCERCRKECIDCVYSIQKQMGRPKKRRKSPDADNATSTSNAPRFTPIPTTSIVKEVPRVAWNSTSTPTAQAGLSLAYEDVSHPCPDTSIRRSPLTGIRTSSSWDTSENSLSSLYSLPDLVMDRSDDSSFTLTIPPELTTPHIRDENAVKNLLNVDLQLDAESHNILAPAMPSCTCLSTMYLTLASLSSMNTSAPFPHSLHPLREAMQGAAEILVCEECPKQFFSGMQNTNAMNSLLAGIAERFSQVLLSINAEAERAEAANESKTFRLAGLQSADSHLHTGGLGSIGAFTISLSPGEWRSMCKKVVRGEIFGPSDGNSCCSYLTGLMTQMEDRQLKWHNPPLKDSPIHREQLTGSVGSEATLHGDNKRQDPACLRMIAFARQMIEKYDWS